MVPKKENSSGLVAIADEGIKKPQRKASAVPNVSSSGK